MKTLCNIFMQNLIGSDTPFEQRTRYSGTSPLPNIWASEGIDRFIRGVNSKRYLHFVGFYFRSTTFQIRSSKASTEHRWSISHKTFTSTSQGHYKCFLDYYLSRVGYLILFLYHSSEWVGRIAKYFTNVVCIVKMSHPQKLSFSYLIDSIRAWQFNWPDFILLFYKFIVWSFA